MSRYYDVCIIGGGILGSFIARNCAKKFKNIRIGLIDAEDSLLTHNSSRNSGVLHTGIYYSNDTLKGKFAMKGVEAMNEFCEDHNIHVNKCGKLVIPATPDEHVLIQKLYEQGLKNGADLELVDKEQMRAIEPLAIANEHFKFALYSKNCAVTDINDLNRALKKELTQIKNLEINKGTKLVNIGLQKEHGDEIITNKGTITAKVIINVAGYDSVRIAQKFNIADNLAVMPLRGFYLKGNIDELEKKDYKVPTTLLYPAPPTGGTLFLGAHTTPTTDGEVKFGPLGVPGLSGRHYSTFGKFSLSEIYNTARLAFLFWMKGDYKSYWEILKEQKRLMKRINMISNLSSIVDIPQTHKFAEEFKWETAGIRSAVFDTTKMEPERDFIVMEKNRSIHVLNYNSPGWTCAIPMAEHILSKIEL